MATPKTPPMTNLGEYREKDWKELTDAEKIERMHGIVRALRDKSNFYEDRIAQMEAHEHGVQGHVLVPAKAYAPALPRLLGSDEWF